MSLVKNLINIYRIMFIMRDKKTFGAYVKVSKIMQGSPAKQWWSDEPQKYGQNKFFYENLRFFLKNYWNISQYIKSLLFTKNK